MPISQLSKTPVFTIQLSDRFACIPQASVINDDVIRNGEPCFAICLCFQDTSRLFNRFDITGTQPPDLKVFGTVDNQNPIDERH